MEDDDEEEEESNPFRAASSDGQTIQLKEDAISFDQASFPSFVCSLRRLIDSLQARRIAMQSAWRTARV
jgi:hypothetical protein